MAAGVSGGCVGDPEVQELDVGPRVDDVLGEAVEAELELHRACSRLPPSGGVPDIVSAEVSHRRHRAPDVVRASVRLSPRAAASSTGTCAAARPSFGTITDRPGDDLAERVAHRDGDAGRLRVDVARQQREPLAAHLGDGRAQLRRRAERPVGEPLQRPAQHPLLQLLRRRRRAAPGPDDVTCSGSRPAIRE